MYISKEMYTLYMLLIEPATSCANVQRYQKKTPVHVHICLDIVSLPSHVFVQICFQIAGHPVFDNSIFEVNSARQNSENLIRQAAALW